MLEDQDIDEPKSVHDAEDRMRGLLAEIQNIDAQLGDKDRRVNLGQDYARWRTGAIWAQTNRLEEYRFLKTWLRRNRPHNTNGFDQSGNDWEKEMRNQGRSDEV